MFEQDNKPRFSITHDNKQLVNFTEEELLAVPGIGQATIDKLKTDAALKVVNEKANKHIIVVYPEWKQLNIMRSGTAPEKEQMNTFIDAVLVWANGAEPIDTDLLTITP